MQDSQILEKHEKKKEIRGKSWEIWGNQGKSGNFFCGLEIFNR